MGKLKLIRGAAESPERRIVSQPQSKLRIALWAAAMFLALKLPMLFITNNPEELRDFDHYARSAQGEYAYKDFVWIYGPLTPIVYGAVLKVLPAKLISVRIFSLALWAIGAAYLALLFARYFRDRRTVFGATLFASGVFGYPSYSHNHVLVAVSAIAATYYLLEFFDNRSLSSVYLSFGCVLVGLFCRPVLMGYGLYVAWMGLFLTGENNPEKRRQFVGFLLSTTLGLILFTLVYGKYLVAGFVPRPWAILETKNYPNLHFLLPIPNFSIPGYATLFAKQIRAAAETGLFYLHYFILPTILLALASVLRYRVDLRGAVVCSLIAWACSFDILHYGFSDPLMEQVMAVRGQYFFALTAAALFLLLWPVWQLLPLRDPRKWASLGVLVGIGIWSYGTFGIGVAHLVKYRRNEFNFPALAGIYTHPDRSAIFEAAAFVNSQCVSGDAVVLPQYDPGIGRLLHCQDLFGKDAYAFTRMPWYPLAAGETPYAPLGRTSNGEMIERRIAEANPRFYITHLSSTFAEKCRGKAWQIKDFGTGPTGRRVCYRP